MNKAQTTANTIAPPTLLVPWKADILCAFCKSLGFSSREPLGIPEKRMKLSATQGCGLCRFFFEELRLESYRSPQRQTHIEIDFKPSALVVLDSDNKRHRFQVYKAERKSRVVDR
jgi:hypothetical protein